MNNHSFDGIIQSYLALHPFAVHGVTIFVITVILLVTVLALLIPVVFCFFDRVILGSICLFFGVIFALFMMTEDDYFPDRISNWAFPSATKAYNAKLLKENMKLLQGCHSGQCLISMSAKEEIAFYYLPDLETGKFVSSFMVKENGDFQGYRHLDGHDVLKIAHVMPTYYYTHILSVNMRNGHGVFFVEVANLGKTEKGIYEVPILKFLHDIRNGANLNLRDAMMNGEQAKQSIQSQSRSDFQNSISN